MRTFENYLVIIICTLGTILDACGGYELSGFYKDMLEEHNKYRKLHDVRLLTLDENLCRDARNHIKLLKPGQFGYPEENSEQSDDVAFYIYESTDTSQWENETIAHNILSFWYNENENYNYSVESTFKSAEHFTQIVWENTRAFGVAITQDDNGIFVVVCYKPPGNVFGKYQTNVKKPNWSIFQ